MATETITVALLGANGQFGNAILHALLSCKEKNFNIVAFISPKADLKSNADVRKVKVVRMDLLTATVAEIAAALKGVEVVLSAVGGNILPRQLEIQDAAAEAGVRRFFPSEFGMHQVVQVPGMGGTSFVHPVCCKQIFSLFFSSANLQINIDMGYQDYLRGANNQTPCRQGRQDDIYGHRLWRAIRWP